MINYTMIKELVIDKLKGKIPTQITISDNFADDGCSEINFPLPPLENSVYSICQIIFSEDGNRFRVNTYNLKISFEESTICKRILYAGCIPVDTIKNDFDFDFIVKLIDHNKEIGRGKYK